MSLNEYSLDESCKSLDSTREKDITLNKFLDDDIREVLNRINLNLPYMVSENTFKKYLESLHSDLEEIIKLMYTMNEIDYFKIPLPDNSVKPIIRKFMGNKYRIFNNRSGKISLRTVPNKEIGDITDHILKKTNKYQEDLGAEYEISLENLSTFQNKIKEINKELKRLKEIPVDRDYVFEYEGKKYRAKKGMDKREEYLTKLLENSILVFN